MYSAKYVAKSLKSLVGPSCVQPDKIFGGECTWYHCHPQRYSTSLDINVSKIFHRDSIVLVSSQRVQSNSMGLYFYQLQLNKQ